MARLAIDEGFILNSIDEVASSELVYHLLTNLEGPTELANANEHRRGRRRARLKSDCQRAMAVAEKSKEQNSQGELK